MRGRARPQGRGTTENHRTYPKVFKKDNKMTELKEIIEKEKQRDTVQLARMIYFYKEGGFMRAYDWSAWLFVKS